MSTDRINWKPICIYMREKSHVKCTSFNIPVQIGLTTLAHILNGYEICLNEVHYPIFNRKMSDIGCANPI